MVDDGVWTTSRPTGPTRTGPVPTYQVLEGRCEAETVDPFDAETRVMCRFEDGHPGFHEAVCKNGVIGWPDAPQTIRGDL